MSARDKAIKCLEELVENNVDPAVKLRAAELLLGYHAAPVSEEVLNMATGRAARQAELDRQADEAAEKYKAGQED